MKRVDKLHEHSDVAAHPDLMLGLMQSVVAFMTRTGMSKSAIRKIVLQSTSGPTSSRRKESALRRPTFAYGCDTVAGAVLRAWHKFPIYLDSGAKPVRLRIDGPEPNLTSLILSQDGRADAHAVVRSMLNAGLLRKTRVNAFLPEKDAATIASLDPLAVDHIAKTIMRLVETATRNIAKSRDKVQLIERYAHVPDLSKSETLAFAAFSRQQGQACLDAIEDWLEARQTKHTSNNRKAKSGVSAGVHIFAYLGEGVVTQKKMSQATARNRATPRPAARA
jgi:hypothetical protein